MAYPVKVYLNWHFNGWLPAETIYDLDAELALTIMAINQEMLPSDGGES